MSPSTPPTLIDLPAELRGARIVLRPYRAGDAEELFAAINESREHLRPWMDWVDNHTSVDDTRDYCIRCTANWLLRTDLALGVYDAASERLLGATGIHEPNWTLRAFEIGYWLRLSALGRGNMTDAVRTLVIFAFEQLQARRIEINCDPHNERSRKVAERAGFVLEGRLRNAMLTPQGEPGDWLVFSLTTEDWQRMRAGSSGDG